MVVTRAAKLGWTVALFGLAAGLVFLAGAVHDVGPLFGVWVPLLTLTWLLTRPEPGDPPRQTASAPSEDEGTG